MEKYFKYVLSSGGEFLKKLVSFLSLGRVVRQGQHPVGFRKLYIMHGRYFILPIWRIKFVILGYLSRVKLKLFINLRKEIDTWLDCSSFLSLTKNFNFIFLDALVKQINDELLFILIEILSFIYILSIVFSPVMKIFNSLRFGDFAKNDHNWFQQLGFNFVETCKTVEKQVENVIGLCDVGTELRVVK